MNKTKIEWCDDTWNPVTGCLHKCEYCYARRIANRFGGASETHCNETVGEECQWATEATGEIHDLQEPVFDVDYGKNAPYPFYFDPTFHRYRLEEPARKTRPRTIFVCSMADLFGEWVPDEWIQEVFKACQKAPQHRYLFLTKSPYRYAQLLMVGKLIGGEHIWLGTTLTGKGKLPFNAMDSKQNFISMEPLLEPVSDKFPYTNVQWVIIGAETGNRKDKVMPQLSWIEEITEKCDTSGIPVFMKNSIVPIVGEAAMRREFPWEVNRR